MIQLYNTLSREKEILMPLKPKEIKLYACGVTVYDYCHLGHARIYTVVDVIIRYLQFSGFAVNYVRNITDIDDKIIKRAQELQQSYQLVTEQYIQAMHADFAELNLLSPTSEPRATHYIPQMIALISQLIVKQHAYIASNGDVYFDVRNYHEYGALSHQALDELESGARVEASDVKRDPLDFVLWKQAKEKEPAWDSPWGSGRPGWHIECSAMAMDLLGEEFDIHLGGRDLIFPHHENEMAQAKAATNCGFAKVWLHGGFLQIDQEKMSKSLGNFITIRDVLKKHSAEVLRYVLIASHYRSPLWYTDEVLQQAKQGLTRLYQALRYLPVEKAEVNTSNNTTHIFVQKFIAAMDDDFNTPVALAVLFELAHEIQRLRDVKPKEAAELANILKQLAGILGILQQSPETYFQSGLTVDVAEIEDLLAARQAARRAKDWQEADRIRQRLASMGIQIEDSGGGTTWRKME